MPEPPTRIRVCQEIGTGSLSLKQNWKGFLVVGQKNASSFSFLNRSLIDEMTFNFHLARNRQNIKQRAFIQERKRDIDVIEVFDAVEMQP